MTKASNIVKDGSLINEEDWLRFIESIETGFDGLETNNERARHKVALLLEEAVKKRASGKFGILFSGGVDSTTIAYICKKLGCDFTCYTIGIENSDDIEWAKKIASEYGFSFRYEMLGLDEFEECLKEAIRIIGDADIVKASVGSVLYAAGKMALENGDNVLFGGIGSEEIFAGYHRHEESMKKGFEEVHKECWNGLKGMWKRDLVRDFTIAKKLGLELRAPFLDWDLVKYSMSIHPMLKISKEQKKIILREAAESIGLKKEFAWRKKQAAQYGSNFVNGIEKLAKKNGFKYKKDYLQSLVK
jgi:asparagine synthetase B (glutamine-hydrolysing)